jgi:hypothetical protein
MIYFPTITITIATTKLKIVVNEKFAFYNANSVEMKPLKYVDIMDKYVDIMEKYADSGQHISHEINIKIIS